MHLAPKIIVSLFFVLIAIAFLAPTLALHQEFQAQDAWLTFLATDSHLFLYFPTLGFIALAAFFLPTLVALDFYWQYSKLGKTRVALTMAAAFVISGFAAIAILSAENKPAWEITPATLYNDEAKPAGCALSENCQRLSIVGAYTNLRTVGKDRGNLKPFVRYCSVDTWIDEKVQVGPERLCIASTLADVNPQLSTDQVCCASQAKLVAAINAARTIPTAIPYPQYSDTPLRILQRGSSNPSRSYTADIHAAALPFKLFFFFVLLLASLAITLNFSKITDHYRAYLPGIEFGLLVGTPAVLFFPLMSQAFLFGNEALFGDMGHGIFSRLVPWLSLAFGLWTMLILLFFYRGRNKESELAAKIIGACLGAITLIKYEAIVSLLMKVVGVGAHWTVLLGVLTTAVFLTLFSGWKIATATKLDESRP